MALKCTQNWYICSFIKVTDKNSTKYSQQKNKNFTKKYAQDFDVNSLIVFSKYCCIFSLQTESVSPFSLHHLLATYIDAAISSFSCNRFDEYFFEIVSRHVINLRLLIGPSVGLVEHSVHWWQQSKILQYSFLFVLLDFGALLWFEVILKRTTLFIWICVRKIFQFGMLRAHQRALKIPTFQTWVTGSISCVLSQILAINLDIYTDIFRYPCILLNADFSEIAFYLM